MKIPLRTHNTVVHSTHSLSPVTGIWAERELTAENGLVRTSLHGRDTLEWNCSACGCAELHWGHFLVCDLVLSRCCGVVGMTSALTCSSLLHAKPHGAKQTPSNAKFNVHVTKDFVLKTKGIHGYKEAECQCSSVHWGDCFSAQELLSFPALPVLFFLPLYLSLEMLSSSSHVLWHLIWYCHQGQFQNFDVKMMSFFLLSLIQQFVHKTAFYSSEATPFQLFQTAPKTYQWGTTAEV